MGVGIAASNALTSRWIDAMDADGGNLVVSGAGVWPLIAVLASGADGQTREELERALVAGQITRTIICLAPLLFHSKPSHGD